MQVCGADFEVGEEMHVAIRPEYMDVSKTPVEGFDLPGTVKDFIYQGTVVKTALDIKNGQEIKYSRFEQDTDIAEGNQVYDFVCDYSDAVYYLYQFYVQRCIR